MVPHTWASIYSRLLIHSHAPSCETAGSLPRSMSVSDGGQGEALPHLLESSTYTHKSSISAAAQQACIMGKILCLLWP